MRLRPKKYDEIDFDSVESSERTRKILREKKCLRDTYEESYREMMAVRDRFFPKVGTMLEIGSGGGFMKDLYPEIVTSDIKPLAGIDCVLNAEALPFADASVSAIFATHVLHHIPDITKFLAEARRVLVPGGGIIAVEPYWSPFAKLLYTHVHVEPYDDRAPSWRLPKGGPMSASNQALSYLLLKRDRKVFEAEFPDLRLVYERPFGFIRYIATGGIWLDPMLPEGAFGVLKAFERLLAPLMPLVAIHHLFAWKKEELFENKT